MTNEDLIELLRPCGMEFPDGVGFAEWGTSWGYHFDTNGTWVKGQTDHLGKMCGQHGGIDIECPEGTLLLAPADGIIAEAGWQDETNPKRGYGLRIILEIEKPKGWLITIGHLSDVQVKKGQPVMAGQWLGKSGATGNVVATHAGSTGAHTHVQFEKPGPYPRQPFNFRWKLFNVGGVA